MKEIDWSKAPEWATKHGKAGYAGPVWFNDHKYTYCDEQQGGKAFLFAGERQYNFNDITGITNRPLSAWNGEGLPPVGTVCEYAGFGEGYKSGFLDKQDVESVEVVLHVDVRGERAAVFKFFKDDGECCGVEAGHSHKFRPILTPEQIAADEREAAISELKREYSPARVHEWMAGQIYDTITLLGYRKP
jgi:hypothetical protein